MGPQFHINCRLNLLFHCIISKIRKKFIFRNKWEEGGGRREAGGGRRELGAGSREQGAVSWEQGAGSWEQGAGRNLFNSIIQVPVGFESQ